MDEPRLSVVLLTWNEARNVEDCLASLARQTVRDFEVIVVDAASVDDTARRVRGAQADFPMPLRLEVASTRIPIGEARNLGVALARGPNIAFLSADAEADEHWAEEALASLEGADLVFGRQIHAPRTWTVAASVRGLRYQFPAEVPPDPLQFASNVSAAYRRQVLVDFAFDPASNGAEDLQLAQRAHDAGYRVAYNPRLVVDHHDVTGFREEMRKVVREGVGWARYRDDLGFFVPLLLWGVLLAAALAILIASPGVVSALVLAFVLWLPALRRAARRSDMPAARRIEGVAASPPFDLVFLLSYLRGLVGRNGGHKVHEEERRITG